MCGVIDREIDARLTVKTAVDLNRVHDGVPKIAK